MKLEHALFMAFAAAFLGVRCLFYWAERLKLDPSLFGMFVIGVVLFGAAVLLLLFAPESLLVPVTIAYAAFVAITCIGIWITGN